MYLFQFAKAPQDAESYIACHPVYKQIPFMALLDFQQKRNGLYLVSMSLVTCYICSSLSRCRCHVEQNGLVWSNTQNLLRIFLAHFSVLGIPCSFSDFDFWYA